MRRGEIAAMQWEHINFQQRLLKIPETKTGVPRIIPLSSKAVILLQSIPRRVDGKVWGLPASSISHRFLRACREAGIDDFRFHDLRHEATSRLFERGLNQMEVVSITGHRDLRMLKRYTHLRPETLLERLG